MERKIFKSVVRIEADRERVYYSDGYIFIKDDTFEGYLTNDYINGFYNNEKFYLEILIFEFSDKTDTYLDFEGKFDYFEPPGIYLLNSKMDSSIKMMLSIEELVSDISTKKRLVENLKEVKAFHNNIPL